ncbi:uncharacterized protein RCC_05149 [Ramularia collo-cygni]|uniref:Uncharacterized protein n=1 Tax=Ramularia collo-cygni TaxID=112498 RepID=A0A2D3USN3_9PEZI|nr:uncharacterized protein RCC_05149 [Ramularia collo-cygni]CZT19301.1 uncharacterized protein RCC_05149 [Ramularia collo-cygni]
MDQQDRASPALEVGMSTTDGSVSTAVHDGTSLIPPATPTSVGSAAQTVFALPELLESILLQISTFNQEDRHLNPAKDLFILQRVNKTFQAVITRNKTLQHHMLLQPNRPGSQDFSMEQTMSWLMSNVGFCWDRHELFKTKYKTLFLRPLDKGLRFAATKDASWRKMKIRFVSVSGENGFWYDDGNDIGLYLIRDRGVDMRLGNHVRVLLSQTLRFGVEMTLGKLHEGLISFMPSLIEYEKAVEEAKVEKTVMGPQSPPRRTRPCKDRRDRLRKDLRGRCAQDDHWL